MVHGLSGGRELFMRLWGYHLPGSLQLDLLKQLNHLGRNLLLGSILIELSRVLTFFGDRLLIKCAGGTTGRCLLLLVNGLEALPERCLLVDRRLLLRWLRVCGWRRHKLLLLDAWLRRLGLLRRVLLLHNTEMNCTKGDTDGDEY